MNIIGREAEQRLLADLRDSRQAEFVALYGRRRVGKTYLVEQFYDGSTGEKLHAQSLTSRTPSAPPWTPRRFSQRDIPDAAPRSARPAG